MTIDLVYENLKSLIGSNWNECYDDIVIAFENYEEDGETNVYVGDSSNVGYDGIAYIDTPGSTQFLFSVDEYGCITDVWMA